MNNVTYDQIITAASLKADELRSLLPKLPSNKELELYDNKINAVDQQLIKAVKMHLDKWGVAYGHAFEEHHRKIASLSAYVADIECRERNITGEIKDEIIQRSWRLGLLHDIERWRGHGIEHQKEGARVTKQKLEELEIRDQYLIEQVLLHDDMEVKSRNNPAFDISFFSVFAVDHLNWGTEWERQKWEGHKKKKTPPEQAIHDFKFMFILLNSPNLQQTKWGREVVLPYINFGIEIARHVEKTFMSTDTFPKDPC